MNHKYRPVVLLILDGWGLSPSWGGNALSMNNPKNIDALWRNYPHAVLQALSAISHGEIIGDSHLGHTMIGAGRAVESNLGRINRAISNRQFYKNEALLGAIGWAKRNNSNLHLLGLISEGGVHSHLDHLLALLNFCHREGFNRVYLDAITDGTDSGPTDALVYLEKIKNKMSDLKLGAISSISGRYYAMDRDENWDRLSRYYRVLTEGSAQTAPSAEKAISLAYQKGLNDEYIEPISIDLGQQKTMPIKDNDAVIFFNFREDRSQELARLFLDEKFSRLFWKPKKINDLYFASFIKFTDNLPAKVAFGEPVYTNTLSESVFKAGFGQLKVAESQKMFHVASFFNGGVTEAWPKEERKIVSSANIKSYDTKPEMSAQAVADQTIKGINSNQYDLIVTNFANVDMVAHTGNIMATGQAIQIVDRLVAKIILANLKAGGATIITADHGNAEQMVQLKKNLTKERETLHTMNPVPFILVTGQNKKNLIQSALVNESNALAKIISATASLADVAPTILELMGLPKPQEMSGQSLLERLE